MDKRFMQRCLDIAKNGRGKAAPNPLVGAVIVHEGRIIGEGWHRAYGGPHAEVNAVASVSPDDLGLLPQSTIYVNLEPCFHEGKTPPCVELLLAHKFRRVVVACLDPNPKVAGQSMAKLTEAGISTEVGLLAAEARLLNAPFLTYHEQKRPYVLLKWAESAERKLSGPNGKPIAISGALANRMVHQWRSDFQAILVGTTTAVKDDPALTARYGHEDARQPIRVTLDKNARIPVDHQLLSDGKPTLVYGQLQNAPQENVVVESNFPNSIEELLRDLHRREIQSVLVEGGATILQAFIDAGCWDEARIFQSNTPLADTTASVAAPALPGTIVDVGQVGSDRLLICRPIGHESLNGQSLKQASSPV